MQIKTILLTSCIIFFALPVNAAEKVNGVNKDIKVLSEVSSVVPDKPGRLRKPRAPGARDHAQHLPIRICR